MIVFLACTKQKSSKPCIAKDMYQSSLFNSSYQYARSLNPRKIYILSALYGLLELNDFIRPYDKTLLSMSEKEKKQWAIKVYKEMIKKNINFDEEAIFLCGKQYRKYLIPKFKNGKAPLKNLAIGKQLQFYKNNVKGVSNEIK